MGTSSRGPGCGTSPTLGELILEMSGHSLNGGTWSDTRKMNQSRIGGLNLGLRAILWENGDAWSVTKYLTLGKNMQPRAEAPGQLPRHHYKSKNGYGQVRHSYPRPVGFVTFSKD